MKKYVALVVLFVVSSALCQNQPGSVADAARSKKPGKKATRVITNDEIPSKVEAAGSTNKDEETAQPEKGSTAATTDAPAPSDQQSDSAQTSVTPAEKKVNDLKARIAYFDQKQKDLEKQIAAADDDNVRKALIEAKDGKAEFGQELRKELAEAEKDLEAEKAGKKEGGATPATEQNNSDSSQPKSTS